MVEASAQSKPSAIEFATKEAPQIFAHIQNMYLPKGKDLLWMRATDELLPSAASTFRSRHQITPNQWNNAIEFTRTNALINVSYTYLKADLIDEKVIDKPVDWKRPKMHPQRTGAFLQLAMDFAETYPDDNINLSACAKTLGCSRQRIWQLYQNLKDNHDLPKPLKSQAQS